MIVIHKMIAIFGLLKQGTMSWSTKSGLPLAKKLLEVLLKGLNVIEIDESLEPLLMGTMNINMKYYPPCPNPRITIGVRQHCNGSCITLLFQDDMGGIYVRGTKGDNWIHVNPIKGTLAVYIGDLLQIMSNDRYKSIENYEAVDSSRDRISIPLFVISSLDSVIGPFPQMLIDGVKTVTHSLKFNTQMTSSKFETNDDILDFVIKKAMESKNIDKTNPKLTIKNQSQQLIYQFFYDFHVEKSIEEAATKWGCFKIINHGIPIDVLEDLKDVAHNEKNEKVLEWRDSIKHGCNPQNDSNIWPHQIRYHVLEYQKWAKPLANTLLDVLLKGLNINEIDETLEPFFMGTININMNYYPLCPNLSMIIGARRHYDGSCITLLFQDDTGGLYVRGTKGDNWIHANPIKGALVVNIGKLLQIMSNDRYQNIEALCSS
ncbi:hypothetical protein H5410_030225 [Solanum commersonii]|uniref:Fe2OG dioxygenase domain-containing protein n=1 Tax=Solanum commersonii TaxID=4109 RepID=A0A9J5YG86_SOLCO|nr:hypothetical protein H5410_030225 [Solanum commersonii]